MPILYDEPASLYHANNAIGSSDLRDYIRSPRLFRDYKDGIAVRVESPSMRFGTLFHMAILEPSRFARDNVVRPATLDLRTKDGKEWLKGREHLTLIGNDEGKTLAMMQERMPAEVRRMLLSGKSEVTVRRTIGALAVQCRPDHWDMTGNVKYDLKTIRAIESIDSAIWKYGYHIQQQWYSRIIKEELGTVPMSRIIFAESGPPWRWRVVDLDLDYQFMADQAIDNALVSLSARMKSGCWDDPDDLVYMASPPSWAMDDDTTDEEEVA